MTYGGEHGILVKNAKTGGERMEKLSALLHIRRGVTALVGSGGKTTAMYRLASELSVAGTVVCATTTHIYPPGHMPVWRSGDASSFADALRTYRCLCAGTPGPEGKLSAPALPIAVLTDIADYVLVEADGSRGLPLKAHLPHEPVIPPEAGNVILLAGASGLGRPVREAAHRPERFCALSGLPPDGEVTVPALAAVIRGEALAQRVFLNQAEGREDLARAGELAALLDLPVSAGSIREGSWICLS